MLQNCFWSKLLSPISLKWCFSHIQIGMNHMCQSQFILHCTFWLDFDFCLTFPWKYFYFFQFCFDFFLVYKGMHYKYLNDYFLKCYHHANAFFFLCFIGEKWKFVFIELTIFLNLNLLVSSCAYIDKFLDVFDIYSYLLLIHHVLIWIYSWWMIEFLNV